MLRAAALLLALLLCSCFDIREEVWVEPGGGGRAELEYTLPTRALLAVGGRDGLEKDIRRLFDEQPDLNLDRLEFRRDGGETRIIVAASTQSLFSLLELRESAAFKELPSASANFAGTFEVDFHGAQIDFTREVDLGKALGFAALAIGREDRETRRITYRIHLPRPALDSNATRLENDGRTLVWEHSLGDALEAPIRTGFRSWIPLPAWIIVAAILLILLIVVLVTRMILRKIRRTGRRSRTERRLA